MKRIGLFLVLFLISTTVWAGTEYQTLPATEITSTTAKLNGKATSTIGVSGEIFQYGKTLEYGMTVAAAPQGVAGPVSAVVTGLECDTEYHYRFIGDPKPPRTTIQGVDMTFKTAPCAQKLCSVVSAENWRDTIHVPQIWTAQDCENYMTATSANNYQLACLTDREVVFGEPAGNSDTEAGTPKIDCGW